MTKDGLRCSVCASNALSNENFVPVCAVNLCSYSEFALPEADAWISTFWALQMPFIKENGLGRKLLEDADAMDWDVIQLFLELSAAVSKVQSDEMKTRYQRR